MEPDAPTGSPSEVGRDPDPRFTFANERTFLAWNRTALALVGGGLAAAQLLHFDVKGLQVLVALPLILGGAVIGFTSYRRWAANERALRLEEPLPDSRLPSLLALGVGIIALVCAIAVGLDVLLR